MADPDSVPMMDIDPQDTAEIFDETHLDDEGEGDALLDELEDVYDATREHSESAPSRLTPHEHAQDLRKHQLEGEADKILGETHDQSEDDPDTAPVADDEVELVFTGLMRNQKGAQASAAHWEARNLSDSDLQELGYAERKQGGDKMVDDIDTPATRPIKPKHGKPDQLKPHLKDAEDRQEALIDEAVEESMDASDPPSPKHIT